jgi:DNA-binding NtrC family response regulator
MEQTKNLIDIKEKLFQIDSLISQQEYNHSLEQLKLLENRIDAEEQPLSIGHLHYLFAVTLYNLGNYQEAVLNGEKALALLKGTNENRLIADTEHMLGRIFMSLGDLKSAELHLRDAVTTYRRIGSQKEIIYTSNRIAQIYYLKSDFLKAVELMNEALQSITKIKDDKLTARFTSNLGRIYSFLGQWEKAEENLSVGLEYNQKSGAKVDLCRDQLALGFLSMLKRDFDKSQNYLESAFSVISERNLRRELAIYYEYSGELAFHRGQFKTSEQYFKNAIEIGNEVAPEGDILNQTYRLLAELQFVKKEYVEALSSCEKSLKVSLSLGDKLEQGAVYRIFGQIYSAQGEKEKSIECFTKSISTLQEISAKFELGKTYLEAGKSTSFDYYQRLGFLLNAEIEFNTLGVKYYIAQVNLSIAMLLFENQGWDRVSVFLDRAENLFKDCEDQKGLFQIARIRQNLQEMKTRKLLSIETEKKSFCSQIITRNSRILEISEKIHQIKDSDVNILLEGETGTGKDLLAKFIHYTSNKKDKKFIIVNCSALPETLLENELFGHNKGAYTGATQGQSGRFEEAEGGTLYLDEIADVPLSIQVKLLRATENKEITRLGDTKPRRIDVRIISSTNRNIEKSIKDGSFRQDLYYRLNTINIKIPPLRERKEDIFLLIKHFLNEFGVTEELIESVDNPSDLTRFLDYDWPGNIRELENEVKRIVVLSGGDKCRFCKLFSSFNQKEGEPEKSFTLPDRLAQFEKDQIVNALIQTNWVQTKGAKLLGIDESVLRYRMRKLGIKNQNNFSKEIYSSPS